MAPERSSRPHGELFAQVSTELIDELLAHLEGKAGELAETLPNILLSANLPAIVRAQAGLGTFSSARQRANDG